MRIALTGNPNSGKTTMYNALTGRNEKVGNWAGVTVEKKEHPIKKAYYQGSEQLIAVDLPGAYSMSPQPISAAVFSSPLNYLSLEFPSSLHLIKVISIRRKVTKSTLRSLRRNSVVRLLKRHLLQQTV